jgi:molybdopterin-containing oxidoreductase family membrane subunit
MSIFIGSLGLFFTCFLLFTRIFPVIAIAEVKAIFSSISEAAQVKAKKEGSH